MSDINRGERPGPPLSGKSGNDCLRILSRCFLTALTLAIVLVWAWYFRTAHQEQEKEMLKTKQADYFSENRGQIIASIRESISKGNYQSAILHTDKYVVSRDGELAVLRQRARTRLVKKETARLLDAVKHTSSADFSKLADLYGQLVYLNPNNNEYIRLLDRYSDLRQDHQIKKLLALPETRTEETEKDWYSGGTCCHVGSSQYFV